MHLSNGKRFTVSDLIELARVAKSARCVRPLPALMRIIWLWLRGTAEIAECASFSFLVCLATKPAPIYRPRRLRQSPLYRTVEHYLPEFERTHDGR
jgi:hypothetical protein